MILRKHPATASRTIAGQGVVLDVEGRMLRGLNATGTRVWELIDGRRSLAEIAAALAREFAVDPGRAAADVEAFARELLARRLVEVVDEGGARAC